jgi:malonyl-CoA/methylmalonyl-CoA synthetase
MLEIISNAISYTNKKAIISNGVDYSYAELLEASEQFATMLLENNTDLHETRVGFMVDPGFDYVKVQWAIWRAGGITVPMCLTHPLPSLQYVIEDTEASIIVVSSPYEALLKDLAAEKNIRLIVLGNESIVSAKHYQMLMPKEAP